MATRVTAALVSRVSRLHRSRARALLFTKSEEKERLLAVYLVWFFKTFQMWLWLFLCCGEEVKECKSLKKMDKARP